MSASQRELELSPAERVQLWGHRRFVGGDDPEAWYGIGRHQYHFLISEGLSHDHKFLDIACGSLRLGQYLIPFLDVGNYFGIEGEKVLVEAGLHEELLFEVARLKQPNFHFSYNFSFAFAKNFDVAIAQSLFTHLTLEDIETCFANLRDAAKPGSTFYFTFFEGNGSENPQTSHAQLNWCYRPRELMQLAEKYAWEPTYFGDWGHPRGQMLVKAVAQGT